MAGAIKPILKGVYLCDDVIGNPAGGKPMLVNLWDTFWVDPPAAAPIRVPKLCVFAWLRGGRGLVGLRVEIVRARTGQMIGRTGTVTVEFAEPNTSVHARIMIPGFGFPEPGEYLVELYCDNEFLDDQRFRLRVRGEG